MLKYKMYLVSIVGMCLLVGCRNIHEKIAEQKKRLEQQ